MAQRQIKRYSNGYMPVDRLVFIDDGSNGIDGYWVHRLPRATLRRWRGLVARAARRRAAAGLRPVELRITSGWCTDRPYAVQVKAKQIHGIFAAAPGFSSHGGIFEGRQTAAIDAGNYTAVYAGCGGYDAWLSDLRAEGFDRLPAGYPLDGERHHIIDYNPWDDEPEFGGAPAGVDAEPFQAPKVIKRAGKPVMHVRRDRDGAIFAIPEGGKVQQFTTVAEYNLNRDTIAVLNGKVAAENRAVLPPAISDLVTVSPEKVNVLVKFHGAS